MMAMPAGRESPLITGRAFAPAVLQRRLTEVRSDAVAVVGNGEQVVVNNQPETHLLQTIDIIHRPGDIIFIQFDTDG